MNINDLLQIIAVVAALDGVQSNSNHNGGWHGHHDNPQHENVVINPWHGNSSGYHDGQLYAPASQCASVREQVTDLGNRWKITTIETCHDTVRAVRYQYK